MTTPRTARVRLGIRISAPEQQSQLQSTLTPISSTDDALDIETWVHLVWGLSKEVIKKVLNLTTGWRLKRSAMDKYIITLADIKKREPDLYQPFKDICDGIIDCLSELEHLPDELSHRVGPWYGKRDPQLVDGAKRGIRNPGFLFLYSSTLAYMEGNRNLWGLVVFPMEVAKSKRGRIDNEEEEDVLVRMRAAVKLTGYHKAGVQSHQPHAIKNIAPPPSRIVVSVGPVAIPLANKSKK